VVVEVALMFGFTQPMQRGQIQAHPQPNEFLLGLLVAAAVAVQVEKALLV
jgi:hypothetical protein